MRLEPLEPRCLLTAVGGLAETMGPSLHTLAASLDPPPPASIVNGTKTSEFPAVGIVNDFCSGTLISPRHVVTAAHCTDDVQNTRGTFRTDSIVAGTLDQIEHPQFMSSSLSNDIAIMVLDTAVNVEPARILREAPVVGEMLTLVGYGDGGTTGRPVHDFPTKRVGHTELEDVTSNKLRWTFDGDGESNTANGDSGGPAFVERNGSLLMAGVTSGGDGSPWNIGSSTDHAWDTRVDVFADWIDEIVSDVVPEPAGDDHADQPQLGATKVALTAGGGWSSGDVQEIGDRDAFLFRIASPMRATVTAVSTDGELDTVLRLYDADGQLLQSHNDVAAGVNTNSRIVRILTEGTFFVTVGAFADSGVGSYSLVIDLGVEASEDQHADLPTVAAGDVAFDADGHTAISGRLETNVDRDVFEFTVDEATPATIAVVPTDAALDPFLRLYDQAGVQIVSNNDGPIGNGSLLETVLQPGTYFASVASFSGASRGTYVFSVQAEVPPVDLFSDVQTVELDARGSALVEGAIADPGGFVTYSFVSRFAGGVTAITRAATAATDTRIAVYDSAHNKLAVHDDRSLTNLNSRIDVDVRENQRYFVVVSGQAGTAGDYWLTMRTTTAIPQSAATFTKDATYVRRAGVSGVLSAAERDGWHDAPGDEAAGAVVRQAQAGPGGRAARDAAFAAWRKASATSARARFPAISATASAAAGCLAEEEEGLGASTLDVLSFSSKR